MAQRSSLKRLRVGIEPNPAGYAVDLTDTIGDLTDLRFDTVTMNRSVTVLPDESVKQRIHQQRLAQFGNKSVAIEYGGKLISVNTAIETGVTSTKLTQSKVIEAIVGGYRTDEGSAVASGSSATGVTVTGTDGAQFIPGVVAGIESASGSGRVGWVVKVKTRSTDALTWGIATASSPAVGAKVYNSQLLYPANIAVASATFLQFLLEGEDRDLIWLGMGCQGSIGISLPLNGHAMWSMQLQGAKWLHDDDMATPQGGSALAVATLDGSQPIPVTAGSAVLTPISVTTRTTPVIDDVVLNPGIAWEKVPSHNGVEGVAQMVQVRGAQPTLTMLVQGDVETWTDVREAQTKYQYIQQVGNVPGQTLALECGTMQLIAEPTLEERNGIDWIRLTWGLLEDENCDDGGTDLERAPWRLACL